MDKKSNRRRSKRFPARWKATVVFDKVHGKPVLHTETQDISTDGASIYSEHPDLTGLGITLLLAPPANTGFKSNSVEVRARVVLTVQTPNKPPYRHSLNFIRKPNDGLEVLSDLSASAPEGLAGAPRVIGISRLEQLRLLAHARLAEEQRLADQGAPNLHISDAIRLIYNYLRDLATQLNVLKPSYNRSHYAIAGVPEFDGLAWREGNVYSDVKELGRTGQIWSSTSLHYHLSSNKQLNVSRDYPASERLISTLTDNRIEFTMHEKRNQRGSVAHKTFHFPCEVKAFLAFTADFDTGRLLLEMRNVERFGVTKHTLAPNAISEKSLDELIPFILGESNHLPLLQRAPT